MIQKKNFVPLPYRRVSVQKTKLPMNQNQILDFLREKPVYFATDFIVFHNDESEAAIVRVQKKQENTKSDLFRETESFDWIAGPADCVLVHDKKVDTGNVSSMARSAFERGVPSDKTLVVEGAFGHLNFIFHPEPRLLHVIDLIPPEPSRLMDLVEKSLMLTDPGPLVPVPRFIDIKKLGQASKRNCVLYPCAASELDAGKPTFFLDQHPTEQDWELIGCERTEAIYRHFYRRVPDRIESCPAKLSSPPEQELSIVRCCSWQNDFEVRGSRAFVPWGADLKIVNMALNQLLQATVSI
jgi:hypothetical protein